MQQRILQAIPANRLVSRIGPFWLRGGALGERTLP
jgi:hypothetical protein